MSPGTNLGSYANLNSVIRNSTVNEPSHVTFEASKTMVWWSIEFTVADTCRLPFTLAVLSSTR